MIEWLKTFIGNNTTAAAEIMSSLVSIGLIVNLFLNIIPLKSEIALGILSFHLLNHLYVGLLKLKVPYCSICGIQLRIKLKEMVEKHKCKTKKRS